MSVAAAPGLQGAGIRQSGEPDFGNDESSFSGSGSRDVVHKVDLKPEFMITASPDVVQDAIEFRLTETIGFHQVDVQRIQGVLDDLELGDPRGMFEISREDGETDMNTGGGGHDIRDPADQFAEGAGLPAATAVPFGYLRQITDSVSYERAGDLVQGGERSTFI